MSERRELELTDPTRKIKFVEALRNREEALQLAFIASSESDRRDQWSAMRGRAEVIRDRYGVIAQDIDDSWQTAFVQYKNMETTTEWVSFRYIPHTELLTAFVQLQLKDKPDRTINTRFHHLDMATVVHATNDAPPSMQQFSYSDRADSLAQMYEFLSGAEANFS